MLPEPECFSCHLPEPPCFSWLYCRYGEGYSTGNASSSGSTSQVIAQAASGSSSRPSIFSSRSSSSRSSSGLFGTSSAQKTATYTIGVKNTASSPARGVVITHGPLSSGAVFDSGRSTPGCTQVGTFVECRLDLQPQGQTTLTLVYTMNNALSCAVARALQTAKSTVSGLTGVAGNIVVTVACRTENMASTRSSSSFSSSSYPSSITTTYPTITSDIGNKNDGYKDGYKGGYKPISGYKGTYVPPRTGSDHTYFASTTKVSDYVLKPFADSAPHSTFSLLPILIVSAFSIIVLGLVLALGKVQKRAK